MKNKDFTYTASFLQFSCTPHFMVSANLCYTLTHKVIHR